MELSGQNVTIIVVALALVALLFYAVHKGTKTKVTSKFAGNELGVELGGAAPENPAEATPGATAAGVGDISHNQLLENADLKGNQVIHVGHNVGAPGSNQPSAAKDK